MMILMLLLLIILMHGYYDDYVCWCMLMYGVLWWWCVIYCYADHCVLCIACVLLRMLYVVLWWGWWGWCMVCGDYVDGDDDYAYGGDILCMRLIMMIAIMYDDDDGCVCWFRRIVVYVDAVCQCWWCTLLLLIMMYGIWWCEIWCVLCHVWCMMYDVWMWWWWWLWCMLYSDGVWYMLSADDDAIWCLLYAVCMVNMLHAVWYTTMYNDDGGVWPMLMICAVGCIVYAACFMMYDVWCMTYDILHMVCVVCCIL